MDIDPARDGQWELLKFHSGVLAVHAATLPNGKVLFFAGSGSSATRFAAPDFGNMAKQIYTSVVWDPQAAAPNNFSHPPTLEAADHRPFDFFCGGDTFLAEAWAAARTLRLADGADEVHRETIARLELRERS